MAFIPGFKNDIFISYVHDDNLSETDNEDGWVDMFYKYLSTKLIKHSKKIKIWWDSNDLKRSEVFNKSIAEAIDQSAIMICLYSRRYPESDYCIKELEHFYKKIEKEGTGLLVSNQPRILPVFLSNIPHEKWLDKLKGTSGFKFHNAKEDNAYGDPLPISTEGPFSEEMNKLRDALVSIIEDFPKQNTLSDKTKIEEISAEPDSTFTIYFGEVCDSLYDRREGIITELKSKGYHIVIGNPSSSEAEIHQKVTKEAIEKAQLAVHMLNEIRGRKIIGDPDNRYIQSQVEIGLETSTPQLIWLTSELEVSKINNTEHLFFVQSLENRSLTEKNYEFVRTNEGELTKVIINQAKHLEEEISKNQLEEKSSDNESLKVLLDTHIDDFKEAFNLKKILGSYNIDLIFNPEDGNPQENLKSIYNNINEAKKFIFLYGNENNKDWVDIRVKNTLKKLMEYDRYKQDIFIYMAPPHKTPDAIKVAQSPLVKVINNSDNPTLTEPLLDQFIIELNTPAK